MFRLLKSMMAQFSYFLEKYMNADSIVWTVIFIALYCSIIFVVILKIVETVLKHKKNLCTLYPLYPVITAITSLIMNRLISTAYTWDSKLQRVMSNFEYIMSFKTNRQIFLSALNLPDNTYNQEHIFKIAMYLNDSQWNTVSKAAGNSAWYFEKVQKAFQDILKLGNWHLSLGITYQGLLTFLPIIAIAAISAAFITKKKKTSGYMMFAVAVLCVLENFGAGIFTCIMLYFGTVLYWLIGKRFVEKSIVIENKFQT